MKEKNVKYYNAIIDVIESDSEEFENKTEMLFYAKGYLAGLFHTQQITLEDFHDILEEIMIVIIRNY